MTLMVRICEKDLNLHPFCQGTAAKIQFATKDKLVSSEVRPAVEDVINTELASYLDENPAEAHAICEKIVAASRAREAARKARDMSRKSVLMSGSCLENWLIAKRKIRL